MIESREELIEVVIDQYRQELQKLAEDPGITLWEMEERVEAAKNRIGKVTLERLLTLKKSQL